MKPRRLTPIEQPEDRQLAERIASLHKPVFFFCLHLIKSSANREAQAEDLAQETMFHAMRSRHTYRHKAALTTWLFKIAIFAYRDQRRNNRRKTWAYSVTLDNRFGRLPAPHSCKVIDEIEFDQIVGQLPLDYQALVHLYRQGAAYAEISKQLGIPEGTAKSRLHRAKQAMKTRALQAHA